MLSSSAMNEKRIAPYGSWKSPITADLIAAANVSLGMIVLDGSDTYWTEMRPSEGGRQLIVRRTADGKTADFTPQPFHARTRVHEYGGLPFTVAGGVVYFSNFADQRIYRQEFGQEPQAVTPEMEMRYADLLYDQQRDRLLCVREDHTREGEAVNTLVAINLAGENAGQVLVSGNDFYASPRLSPDGQRLAWLTWNHPNMPWDGTELWAAEIKADGSLANRELIAGGVGESIFQPEWSPDGELYFVSDRSGWWNLYRRRARHDEPLLELDAEFGLPQWLFGMSTYGFVSDKNIACTYKRRGVSYLAYLDLDNGRLDPIETPFDDIHGLRVAPERVVFNAASSTKPSSVVQVTLPDPQVTVFRSSSELTINENYLSKAKAIKFPTANRLTAHAIYYPPSNKDFQPPAGERPPLIVMSHGGPTSSTSTALKLGIHYWTSRGFAVLDVNYGGSTGYGRAYRERLKGQWGVVDVDDCINGACFLIKQGLADENRLAIRGGSAGGYTTLCALTFRNVFQVGASYFGVSDLEALAKETHKFESRYLDSMVGPYPEMIDLYRERSPIFHVNKLSAAIILLQGLEDRVVPPSQAELMVDAVRGKGLPVAYVPFEGEQHGFRKAENIKRALEAELYFYGKVLGFDIADRIDPVVIENI